MSAVAVIPARWGSTRFPGKPLVDLAGKPMIQRTWERARQATSLRDAIIATDDARIEAACRGFGATVVRTRADHATGTDRIAEVAAALDDAIVVNVQGDEPLIDPGALDALVGALASDSEARMATLVHPGTPGDLDNPHRVKVVLDVRDRALWFSRSPLPFPRDEPAPVWVHVGVYAFRRPFLMRLVQLARTPAERAEGLEQLRALEHGHAIRAVRLERWHSACVDVPEDVPAVLAALDQATQPR